jgi:DNA-binding CsgD family transcriptional regulator/tetratricopeptide (TPR) repeat protein
VRQVPAAVRAPIERDGVLAAFAPLIEDALNGRGRLVFVGGEAGVGKTTVTAALAATVGGRLLVRRGGCDDLATATPLGPLADAVPELADLLDGATPGSRPGLFRRLRAALVEAPTLLVVEDVHWADEATLDLLRFLGRRLVDAPLLVVATFRADEAVGDHPLALLRGDLATADGVERIDVPPLSKAGVAELVARAESPLDPATLHRSTGGNPFFVTELLALGDDSLPGTVRDAVLARAARVSVAARDVLGAAAVLGSRAELAALVEVSGQPAEVVDECVRRGMLVADGEGWSFRHELARRTIEESLAPAERQRRHAAALAAARRDGLRDDGRLAHHAAGCGDRAAVLDHAPRAAERAAALGAHREAAALYRLTLRFAVDSDAEQAQLYEKLAYECYLTDQPGEAHTARVAALARWERLGDVARVGANRRWLSRLAWFLGHNAEAERQATRAVATLEPLGPSAELAMAYSNMAQLRMLGGDVDGAVDWGNRAITLARYVGATEVEMHALNNVGSALWGDAEMPEGRTQLTQSLDLALAADAHEHAARAFTNLGSGGVEIRRYAEADVHLRAGIAYCEERDLDSWWLYMTAWLARSSLEQGRIAEAERCAREVLRRPHLSAIARIPAEVVAIHLGQRRGEELTDRLTVVAELAAATGELQRIAPVAIARAEAAWIAGDPAGIAAALDEVWPLAVQRRRRWTLGELAWWSALGDGPRSSPMPLPEPFARMLAGDWVAAAEAWRDLNAPLWEGIALACATDLELARRGLELLATVDAPAVRDALIRDRHRRGLAVPRGPRAAARSNAFSLTARELDVLTLVAEGLTNAEVAQQLFLSEKTVGHHVSAALRKLGEPTRARAVAAARRAGLVGAAPAPT